jgi:hypothetical protein
MVLKSLSTALKQFKYILWGICLLIATIGCVAFSIPERNEFDLAKEQVLLRQIGHEILLSSGDKTSRVLPVHKIAENEYQIRFENEFTFQTDSLVHIIKNALKKDDLASDYLVKVLHCSNNEVIYSFMILSSKKEDIVSCSGRKQSKACYLINLKFQSRSKNLQNNYLIGGLGLLTSCGLLLGLVLVTSRNVRLPRKSSTFQIGNTLFDEQKRTLFFAGATIELTLKENKLLLIFAKSLNQIIERNQLQKEIWEDEGVIVGRSLDMFISKLRKKLENDSSIQLKNIHGKGYKLETDS